MDKIIVEHKSQKEVKVASQWKSNFYVDDLIAGFNSIEEASQFREAASKIFTDIGM